MREMPPNPLKGGLISKIRIRNPLGGRGQKTKEEREGGRGQKSR